MAMQEGIHVALSAEKLGEFLNLPITNTLITSWIVVLLLVVVAFVMGRRLKMMPGRFQTVLEWALGSVYDYVTNTLGSKDMARRFFSPIVTLLLFIFTA